jgi:hypothetical protein
VSDHCALSSEMPSALATDGISGAPRLLITPVTIVTPIRTGTRAQLGTNVLTAAPSSAGASVPAFKW